MIKKIISGGQIGADQAALDMAIKYNVPHGGWIQKGRKTQRGILAKKYKLKEMSSAGFKERIEKNTVDSDGTLIISHGNLTGGSDYSKAIAKRYNRQYLHINLKEISVFQAVSIINTWIIKNNIKILNVTGSRTSEDSMIYKDSMSIVEGVIFLRLLGAGPGENITDYDKQEYLKKLPILPKTVDEAVELLITNLSVEEKVKMSNMSFDDINKSNSKLLVYFKKVTDLLSNNKKLLSSCRSISKDCLYNVNDASRIIIEAFLRKVRKTCKLKVVK